MSSSANPPIQDMGKQDTGNQNVCVLLVDDDHDVLGANARYLRVNDLNVVVADQASTAIERLKAEPIDVVVTDLRMPNCDGIEFAHEVRDITPLLPIVFLSGFATVPETVSYTHLTLPTKA